MSPFKVKAEKNSEYVIVQVTHRRDAVEGLKGAKIASDGGQGTRVPSPTNKSLGLTFLYHRGWLHSSAAGGQGETQGLGYKVESELKVQKPAGRRSSAITWTNPFQNFLSWV